MNDIVNPSATRSFVISHLFHAPLDRVWQAWSDGEQLKQWFGPAGISIAQAKLDFRPGGIFHFCMHTPDGRPMWGRFAYREIEVQRRIVWVNSFSDENGGLTRHPAKDTWPLELLTTITLSEAGEYTKVTLEWLPYNASEEERQTFNNSQESVQQGWSGTFGRLTGHLAGH
jgi:uncharacterized protein YndB with AHSA1/START domain